MRCVTMAPPRSAAGHEADAGHQHGASAGGRPLRPEAAFIVCSLRTALERSSTPLAAMDLLIASHALSEGCTLISADQAFAQVPGLSVEVW